MHNNFSTSPDCSPYEAAMIMYLDNNISRNYPYGRFLAPSPLTSNHMIDSNNQFLRPPPIETDHHYIQHHLQHHLHHSDDSNQ
ncbi:hypothetical protein GJ496_004718 [Pomphorhynchus laevis]|nr:hypothetical protein GJ496_004718 [Pomphorhynchus laevis]